MGLFSKIIKGIKNIVKGVAKVIKKTVKGVAKVVKKVAKSKIFKAVLAAAAIYVTGGAAAGAFGASGTGFFGTWAANAANVVGGTSALGAAGKVLTPFAKLGSKIGTGARGVSDFVGFTTKGAELGAGSITGVEAATAERGVATAERATSILQQAGPNATATEVATAARGIDTAAKATEALEASGGFSSTTRVAKGPSWDKFTGRFTRGTILGDVARNVAGQVASGYLMDKINPDFEEGRKTGLDVEGPSNFDPFGVYGSDRQPLSLDGIYSELLYGNADPLTNGGNTSNLYTQDIAPIAV